MNGIKEKLIKIVGKKNVLDKPEILKLYSKDKSFAKEMKPWFVVKPENAEQVQQLVKWANESNTPLVPVSSGAPHFKGDTVPSVPQSVIVDLSGMKKIISINRQMKMCIVEPGVTYGELQKALAEKGMTLSTSLAPKATKSVLTSVLEVEPRLNALHQFNYIEPLRCVEVTWGDGNQMYTGEALGNVKDLQKQWEAERWQVMGNGPNMFDFFRLVTQAQGTMGIVTWASLKCEILPTIHKMYLVPAKKSEDLNDFVYRVLRLRFSDELMVMNGTYLASLLGETAEEVAALKEKLPKWVALVGIVGREIAPELRVSGQEKDVEDIARQFGLELLSSVPGTTGEEVLGKAINPSKEIYWKDTYKGASQDIFFSTTLDKTSKFIDAMYALAIEEGYSPLDIGVYIQPQNMGTSVHLEFNIPYDPQDTKEVAKAKKLYTKASEEMSSLGAYYSRPYDIWAKLQLNKDAQSYNMLKKYKGIFDPNNILNTGKLSI